MRNEFTALFECDEGSVQRPATIGPTPGTAFSRDSGRCIASPPQPPFLSFHLECLYRIHSGRASSRHPGSGHTSGGNYHEYRHQCQGIPWLNFEQDTQQVGTEPQGGKAADHSSGRSRYGDLSNDQAHNLGTARSNGYAYPNFPPSLDHGLGHHATYAHQGECERNATKRGNHPRVETLGRNLQVASDIERRNFWVVSVKWWKSLNATSGA